MIGRISPKIPAKIQRWTLPSKFQQHNFRPTSNSKFKFFQVPHTLTLIQTFCLNLIFPSMRQLQKSFHKNLAFLPVKISLPPLITAIVENRTHCSLLISDPQSKNEIKANAHRPISGSQERSVSVLEVYMPAILSNPREGAESESPDARKGKQLCPKGCGGARFLSSYPTVFRFPSPVRVSRQGWESELDRAELASV